MERKRIAEDLHDTASSGYGLFVTAAGAGTLLYG